MPSAGTRDWLLDHQAAGGYWVAELEGDTILESEYILLLAFLGRHHRTRARKAARYIQDATIAHRRLGDLSRRPAWIPAPA